MASAALNPLVENLPILTCLESANISNNDTILANISCGSLKNNDEATVLYESKGHHQVAPMKISVEHWRHHMERL
jgi:hypothetical protein